MFLLERIRKFRIVQKLWIRQGTEERDYRRFLSGGEIERPHPAVKVRMRLEVAAVMVDDRIKRLQLAIVHIWPCDRDVAERWRLEPADIARTQRHLPDATVRADRIAIDSVVRGKGHG